jgi:NADPH:quinone reductase-like Zn-dependent oxidoreductase
VDGTLICELAGGRKENRDFPSYSARMDCTIAAVGSRVQRLRVGDKVYAYSFNNPKGGFYAEYAAVPATNAAPVPNGFDLIQAGAIPAAGLTALQGSTTRYG